MLRESSDKPNVVLITADSLRADHMGCYGLSEGPSRTPYFDELATRSVLFLNAFSPGPYTAAAMPPLFTGRYACRLKPMQRSLPFWGLHGTTVEGSVTVTEILRAAGYRTAAFHANPLLSRLTGFQKGFDAFFDDLWLGAPWLPHSLLRITAQAYRLFRLQPSMSARGLNEKVKAWLERAPEPFFLVIHYMDTHGPYLRRKFLKAISPSERAWRRCGTKPEKVTPRQHGRLVRNYGRQVGYLDAQWGELWRLLENRGILDRSLLIVSADHGEEFREHGGYSHTCKLYDELIHVPMLAHFRGIAPRRIETLVETIQIAPTVLDFAGIRSAEAANMDSTSFLPLLRGQPYSPQSFTYSEAGPGPHDHVCARTAKWKLIWQQGGQRKELYDLAHDPREQINVAAEHPDIVRELSRKIEAHCAAPAVAPREPKAASLPVSREEEAVVVERLRDLGYL